MSISRAAGCRNRCGSCLSEGVADHTSDLRKDGMAQNKITLVPVWRETAGACSIDASGRAGLDQGGDQDL
jgi:alkylhydroperoxidase family enzyme